MKTQFICAEYVKEKEVLVAGDTKGNLFVFDYKEGEDAY